VCGAPLAAETSVTHLPEDETQLGGLPIGARTPVPPEPGTGPEGMAARTDGQGFLSPGQNFGTRYHIIRLLGAGGMGAVYQAWDRTLEVAVAVKIIRPQAAADPEAAQLLERRFKRELLLARQVTHKNVVRIHDLGEIDGITYITMPYVQGSDLATILRKEGRLPVDRVLSIARQVGAGLVAAHEAGVVHRDLKPANIMIDADDGALIMDFGIARSTAGGMTMTVGGGVGTIEYMAPEQAHGEAVDQRADIYAFGLILNDMLLGRRQTGASTAVAELMARIRQAPASVRSIDPTIPAWLDALITRCLAPDPAARYERVRDVLAEFDTPDHGGGAAARPSTTAGLQPPVPMAAPAARTQMWRWLLAAGAVVVLAGAAWAFRGRLFSGGSATAGAGPAISLAVLPFKNASGDPTLDSLGSSLSQVLSAELGQSSRVRAVPSDRLHQVLQDLQIAPNATLAPQELARVADFTNARRVLWGQYTRFGDAIRIDATLQDLDRNQSVPLNALAPNEVSLLTAIGQLSDAVRENLARGSADMLSELKATSWKPSTGSFEALRLYNEGARLSEEGTYQQAQKAFDAAIKQDGNFALAYSGLARTYATLGYDAEAVQNSNRAMSLSDALPPYEKYLISANHYRIVNDAPKAIEAYENLVKAAPNSATIQFDLGGLYEQSGDLDKARVHFAKVVELDPKFVEGLLALGRVDIKRGHPQDALTSLNAALTLAIQLNHDEARANIQQAVGVAYKRLDRLDEALRNYQESLAIKERLGNKRGMAASLSEIGQIQERQGKLREAEQTYQSALKLQREIGDKAGVATSLLTLGTLLNESLGRPDDALPYFQEALQLRREAGNPAGEAMVLNNIGNVYLAKGQYSEAQTYFERTLELREKANVRASDLADTLHNLGETLSKEGRYDQALARYLRAIDLRRNSGDKRGAAIESYSMGTVFDYLGRYGAAVKAKEDALQTLREQNQRDTWLAEVLGGYGNSLSLAGRTADAVKPLDDALSLARELQNPILIAQTMRFQAARLFYAGDVKGAGPLADQAADAASRTSDKSLQLLAQVMAAESAAAAQPTQALAARLAKLAQDADSLGLPSLAVECAVNRAEALLKLRDRANGQRETERALARAETLGFRVLAAKAHYLRAEALRQAGDADAKREYGLAVRLLNDLGREDGNQNVLKRADLAGIYADATPDPISTSVPGSGTAAGAWATRNDWKLSSRPPMPGSSSPMLRNSPV
jgi:tetratricopeptide (TPR) repeat protein/tRNA A-37 threonylcarbamoyl transferase component Bud32